MPAHQQGIGGSGLQCRSVLPAGCIEYRLSLIHICKIAGKEDYADVRNVMIMGGSRIAVRTSQYVPGYMQLKIVDNDLNLSLIHICLQDNRHVHFQDGGSGRRRNRWEEPLYATDG